MSLVDFKEKTYAKILQAQMDRVPNTIDKREGSVIQTALGPESWYLEGVYMDMAKVQDNATLAGAQGIYLDYWGQTFNVLRKPATHAVRKGRFNMKVPIGTRFAGMTEIALIYAVTSEIGKSTDGMYEYRMTCETAGMQGNEYVGQMMPVSTIPGLARAEVTDILENGAEEEDDDALRARIYARTRRPAASGNTNDYYNWATEVAGVGAARIFPLANGPGTVKVVVADSDMNAAGEALIRSVRDHIEALRPIGATVSVVSAVEKAINVTASIRLSGGVVLGDAQNTFRQMLVDYLQQNAFGMTYISLARIGNLLLDTVGVEDYAELKLNGSAANVTLANEQIAVAGTVTLEVMT